MFSALLLLILQILNFNIWQFKIFNTRLKYLESNWLKSRYLLPPIMCIFINLSSHLSILGHLRLQLSSGFNHHNPAILHKFFYLPSTHTVPFIDFTTFFSTNCHLSQSASTFFFNLVLKIDLRLFFYNKRLKINFRSHLCTPSKKYSFHKWILISSEILIKNHNLNQTRNPPHAR